MEIVNGIKYVDKTIAKNDVENIQEWEQLQFNVFFKGDDWKGTEKGKRLEEYFSEFGVRVVYFPYTKGTSSPHLKMVSRKLIE